MLQLINLAIKIVKLLSHQKISLRVGNSRGIMAYIITFKSLLQCKLK